MKLLIRQKLGIVLLGLTVVATVIILLRSPSSLVEVRSSTEEIEREAGSLHSSVSVEFITLRLHYLLPLLICGIAGILCAVWPPHKPTKQP